MIRNGKEQLKPTIEDKTNNVSSTLKNANSVLVSAQIHETVLVGVHSGMTPKAKSNRDTYRWFEFLSDHTTGSLAHLEESTVVRS